MIKRITLLLATLLAVGFFSNTVLAQDEETTGEDSTQTTPKPVEGEDEGEGEAEGEGDPECD